MVSHIKEYEGEDIKEAEEKEMRDTVDVWAQGIFRTVHFARASTATSHEITSGFVYSKLSH